MGVLLELLGRGLAEVGAALRVVATVGLLLAIQGLSTIIYGAQIQRPAALPAHQDLPVAGVNVGSTR